MNARQQASLAALTLCTALAQAAEPTAASQPAMRTVNTAAGPIYELAFPSTPPRATSAPATDVQATPAGPMLVLRSTPTTSTSNLRKAPTSTFPANVQAQALPNGAQVLVLPTREMPAAASTAPTAVVEIDPGKPGTRMEDRPRNDVLYRAKPAVATANR